MHSALFHAVHGFSWPNLFFSQWISRTVKILLFFKQWHINEAQMCIPTLHGWAHQSNSAITLQIVAEGHFPWRQFYHQGPERWLQNRSLYFQGSAEHSGFPKDLHFQNSIRVCERSICQNCLQWIQAPYLCPWDSEGASTSCCRRCSLVFTT